MANFRYLRRHHQRDDHTAKFSMAYSNSSGDFRSIDVNCSVEMWPWAEIQGLKCAKIGQKWPFWLLYVGSIKGHWVEFIYRYQTPDLLPISYRLIPVWPRTTKGKRRYVHLNPTSPKNGRNFITRHSRLCRPGSISVQKNFLLSIFIKTCYMG